MSSNDKPISPKKRRLERERKYRRDTIIKIAEKFFISQGYSQTMVDKIADEAGYSKATIYNYFESKDDLFVAVAAIVFEKLFHTFESTLNQPDIKFELRSLGDAYVIFLDEYPDYAAFFDPSRLGLAIERMIKKEETNQLLTESEKELRYYQLKIEKLMRDVILETMKNAGVSTKLDPFSVIMALSTLDSAIRVLLVRGAREYLDVLFTIIDKGLKHYFD
ncbi:MAG: TetR/AcrR family transcriptional regulator [Candidatus Heimdallarchaeota archaeon]|nr:MAG: TetR/AcrR family transcriptional regulator [Candidatus Heimdallarchaeota archaeon]